jgi:hypothetical protein
MLSSEARISTEDSASRKKKETNIVALLNASQRSMVIEGKRTHGKERWIVNRTKVNSVANI